MHFVNFLGDIPATRESFKGYKKGLKVYEGHSSYDDVDIVLRDGYIEVVKEGTVELDTGEVVEDVDTRYPTLLSPSRDTFRFGEEYDDEPLIWIAAESILLPSGEDVTMSYIPLDEGMLVCLQRGIIQVQVDSTGETMELVRGLDSIPNVLRWMSASSGRFAGIPETTHNHEAFLTFTINRKISNFKMKNMRQKGMNSPEDRCYLGFNGTFKAFKGQCFLIDEGEELNGALERRANRERLAALKAERDAEVTARHAIEVERLAAINRAAAEEKERKKRSTSSVRSSASREGISLDDKTRNEGAEAYLEYLRSRGKVN